jgi:hypothetical protein
MEIWNSKYNLQASLMECSTAYEIIYGADWVGRTDDEISMRFWNRKL